ncbi:hypothetical protein D3C87_1576960 [compost metagenome]
MLVARDLAAEGRHVAGNDVARALDLGGLLVEGGFLGDFRQVVAIHHLKAAAALQMADQNRLGLAAQAVHAVGEHAAQIIRPIVELADGNRAAHAFVRLAGRRDGRHRHGLRTLSGATRDKRRQQCQRPDLHDLVQHHFLQPAPSHTRGQHLSPLN